MLPPFIIEQIRKREEKERTRQDSPVRELELPLPPLAPPGSRERRREDEPKRGIVIIDLGA